jgi:hypothetical protein
MTARPQIGEHRQVNRPETGIRRIVLRNPGTSIHLVMEGVVRRIRQIGPHRKGDVRHSRCDKVDLHLSRRGIRGRAKILVGAVVRPGNKLTA